MRTAALLVLAVLFAQHAAAQQPNAAQAPVASPTADTGEAEAVKIESVWDFVVKGGPLMIPIGLCSLLALTVIVERLISLRRRQVIPPRFFPGLTKLLEESHDREKALRYCDEHPSPVANILTAGLKKLGEPLPVLEKHIQEAGEREVVRLRKYLRILSVTAAIAPLLGLLGTIFGMITAFQTVAASGEALGKTELLAKGIYEAMITTAAGLMVAIPVLIAYHALSAKVDGLVHEMDRLIVELLEKLWSPPQARPVPRSAGPSAPDRTPDREAHDGKIASAVATAGNTG